MYEENGRYRGASLSAGAMDAPVTGAGPADQRELLPQRLAGAMDADSGVSWRDSCLCGKGLQALLGQIDVAENFAVSGLHAEQSLTDALADNLLRLNVGDRLQSKVLSPALQGAIFCGAVTIVVNDRIAQHAIEPCRRGLFAAQGRNLFDGPDVGGLQNVFGGRGRVHTPLDEVEKLAALLDQPGD